MYGFDANIFDSFVNEGRFSLQELYKSGQRFM